MGQVIVEFRESITLALDPDKMRQKNCLNPAREGVAMTLPTTTGLTQRAPSVPLHDELVHADQYMIWVIYAVFCCPGTLTRPEIFQMFQQLGRCFLVIQRDQGLLSGQVRSKIV